MFLVPLYSIKTNKRESCYVIGTNIGAINVLLTLTNENHIPNCVISTNVYAWNVTFVNKQKKLDSNFISVVPLKFRFYVYIVVSSHFALRVEGRTATVCICVTITQLLK